MCLFYCILLSGVFMYYESVNKVHRYHHHKNCVSNTKKTIKSNYFLAESEILTQVEHSGEKEKAVEDEWEN